jgi:hypothetical protein
MTVGLRMEAVVLKVGAEIKVEAEEVVKLPLVLSMKNSLMLILHLRESFRQR